MFLYRKKNSEEDNWGKDFARTFADKIWDEANKISSDLLAKRQEIFKKNEEKSV